MAYKFLNASLQITGKNMQQEFVDYFHYKVEQEFENAPNVFTIQEEYPFGSGQLRDVRVRISQVINQDTGVNQGDDWKKLVFANGQQIGDGQLFFFDENWWMVANAETIKSLSRSCVVRRCTNTLRWIDEQGGKHEVPCILDYKINENRDYSTAGSSFISPSGVINAITQFNSQTNKIKSNTRFLFGNADNWTCYRVFGGGIQNFINQKTMDNESVGAITLTLGVDRINEQTDDLINGYTDVYHMVYTVSIPEESIVGQIGNAIQLTSTVQLNGSTVTRDVVWSSSNNAIATVSSTGLVTFMSAGNCNIVCSLKDNATILDTCSASVTSYPVFEYTVKVSPEDNYILEGDTKVYSAYLYSNNILQNQAFTFTIQPGSVPIANYGFTVIDGNHFSITNKKMYLNEPLVVICSGGSEERLFGITLKGRW